MCNMAGDNIKVVNFTEAIAEHEDRIADLVLSICASAFGGGVSGLLKVDTMGEDPLDLLDQSVMQVDLIDERLFSDSLSSHAGRLFTFGETERMLRNNGFVKVQNLVTTKRINRRGARTHVPTTIYAPEGSVVHRLKGRALKKEIHSVVLRQISDAKTLSLELHLWHFETMYARMVS